jgi:hypothetical protein
MKAIQTDGRTFFAVFSTPSYARLDGRVHATIFDAMLEHPQVPLGTTVIGWLLQQITTSLNEARDLRKYRSFSRRRRRDPSGAAELAIAAAMVIST